MRTPQPPSHRVWILLAAAVAASVSACSRHRPGSTARPTATATSTTSPAAGSTAPGTPAARPTFDLAAFTRTYSHAPAEDGPLLTNSGFHHGEVWRDGARTRIVALVLTFQGRDGAEEIQADWDSAARQREAARPFTVPGVARATAVAWYDASVSATIEQVLFAVGTRLVVVEGRTDGHGTNTDAVRAAAREVANEVGPA